MCIEIKKKMQEGKKIWLPGKYQRYVKFHYVQMTR